MRIGGVAGQPIDRLGRDRDDLACLKQRKRRLHRFADFDDLRQFNPSARGGCR
jgi:hypothetical protein